MRRFKALLFAAGLAATPASAAAHPCLQSPNESAFEKVERSTRKGRLGVLVMSLTPELRKHFGAAEGQADDRRHELARSELVDGLAARLLRAVLDLKSQRAQPYVTTKPRSMAACADRIA